MDRLAWNTERSRDHRYGLSESSPAHNLELGFAEMELWDSRRHAALCFGFSSHSTPPVTLIVHRSSGPSMTLMWISRRCFVLSFTMMPAACMQSRISVVHESESALSFGVS